MSLIEQMRRGELTDTSANEVMQSMIRANRLITLLRGMSPYDTDYRDVLGQLIPGFPATGTLIPPFYCDHGHGIRLGESVYINANCTFLDGAFITIGDHTLIGPNVQIYTPHHPIDHVQRREPKEYAFPVTIGSDCWIGGGAIICPGVTIGNRCIIGAGSVVTKDIPDGSMAVGNPARVIRKL